MNLPDLAWIPASVVRKWKQFGKVAHLVSRWKLDVNPDTDSIYCMLNVEYDYDT